MRYKYNNMIPHYQLNIRYTSYKDKYTGYYIVNNNLNPMQSFDSSDAISKIERTSMIVLHLLIGRSEFPYCSLAKTKLSKLVGVKTDIVDLALKSLEDKGMIHKHKQSVYEIKPTLFNIGKKRMAQFYFSFDRLSIGERFYEVIIKDILSDDTFVIEDDHESNTLCFNGYMPGPPVEDEYFNKVEAYDLDF